MGVVLATLSGIGAAITSFAANAALDLGLASITLVNATEWVDALNLSTGLWEVEEIAVEDAFLISDYTLTEGGWHALYASSLAIGGATAGGLIGYAADTGSIGSGNDAFLQPSFKLYEHLEGNICAPTQRMYGDDTGPCKLQYTKQQSMWMESGETKQRTMQSSGKNRRSTTMEWELGSAEPGPSKAKSVAKSTKRVR